MSINVSGSSWNSFLEIILRAFGSKINSFWASSVFLKHFFLCRWTRNERFWSWSCTLLKGPWNHSARVFGGWIPRRCEHFWTKSYSCQSTFEKTSFGPKFLEFSENDLVAFWMLKILRRFENTFWDSLCHIRTFLCRMNLFDVS